MSPFDLSPDDAPLAAALGLDDADPLPADLLAGLPGRVAYAIAVVLPELGECRPIAGRFDVAMLEETSVRTPAVLVSLVGWRSRSSAAGQWAYTAQLAAFVVTRDRMGLPRDAAALTIAQSLTALVDACRWGHRALGQAEQIASEMLVTAATRGQAASLAVVTWLQPFVLTGAPAHAVHPVFYLGSGPDQIVIGLDLADVPGSGDQP